MESPPPLGVGAAEMESKGKSKRRLHPAIPFLGAILLIVAVLVGLVVLKRRDPGDVPPVAEEAPKDEPAPKDDEERNRFWRDGWKQHTSYTLTGFLKSRTPEDKARYVLGGEAMTEKMREFYLGDNAVDDSDTPIDSFSHFDLDITDKKRGLFLMQYERPAQYNIREFFRPVAPLEIQHKLEEPGILLSAFAARENFAMEPVRVMAFFKEVGDELRLDWEVYSQTKYRTLRHFVTYPQPGQSRTFRVMASEVMPPSQGIDLSTYRYFRFSDPAHAMDKADVLVAMNTVPGQILSELAWINIPDRDTQKRYATLELAWTEEEQPRITLKKVICWEFLGLGGVEGNADPIGVPDPTIPVELDALEPDPLAPAPPSADGEGAVSIEIESEPREALPAAGDPDQGGTPLPPAENVESAP